MPSNSSECCGRVHKSAYCPDCGRRIDKSPLWDLLIHVRKTTAEFQKRVERFSIPMDLNEDRATYRKIKLSEFTKIRDKWISWKDSLESLVANNNKGQD